MAKDTKALKADLEKGLAEMVKSDRFVELLDTFAKFHQYSFTNSILIMLQKPEGAGRVAGYRAWETKFDRHVKKGAKALWIFAPNTHKRKVTNENGEEEEEQYITSFRSVPVFSEFDTEGAPLPEVKDFVKPISGKVKGYRKILKALESATTAKVSYVEINDGSNGRFSRTTNTIEVKKGMSQTQTIRTLAHEVAHSLLHCKGGKEVDEPREVKELEAESTAYIVCRKLGFDTSDYSFGYVATWAESHTMDELRRKLDIIGKTADKICEAIA